jgi:caffeoyl-CoA O-methyltransferase
VRSCVTEAFEKAGIRRQFKLGGTMKNMSSRGLNLFIVGATVVALTMAGSGLVIRVDGQEDLDGRVRKFLDDNRGQWRDMNVPAVDGQTLYDIIVKNKYTRALEIGTSTGHSGIWIAWALSKTGGKLITIEIDERRHRQAVANFEAAGLKTFIDARLGDAHQLVPALSGPFDFVFSDADKDWYKNYLDAALPKLELGGCYVTHNVSPGGRRGASGDYLTYLESLSNLETTLDSRGAGMAISYKKRN